MKGNHSLRPSICIGAVITLIAAPHAEAMGPVYVDLGLLFLTGVLYLVGLIAILVGIGRSREPTKRRVRSWLFAAYIIAPIAYFYAEVKINAMHSARIKTEMEVGQQKNREAFGVYCKDRKRVVYHKVKEKNGASLAVRIDKNLTGGDVNWNAYRIFEFIHREQGRCFETGVKFMEGIFYNGEIRRYSMCTRDKWEVVSKEHSRYELVLGQTGSKERLHGPAGGQMSKSSVQIIERSTGTVLAEDTMYFLQFDTGEGGCPSGLEQLSDLIVEVFGRK
jgi:hypothetical protein